MTTRSRTIRTMLTLALGAVASAAQAQVVLPPGGAASPMAAPAPSTQAAASGRTDWSALSLADAARLVLERNREVRLAQRALESARADVITAGAQPNPNLTLGLSAINPQKGVSSTATPRSARLEQLIERGNKRGLRIAQAERLESAASADLDDALRQQWLAVAEAYFDLLLAQERVSIAGETYELAQRGLEATDRRLRAGDVAAADATKQRVEALRAQNEVRAANADLARAQLSLAYLLGAERTAAALRASDRWPSADEVDAPTYDEQAIEARPDVRAARERVVAATRARELAQSLRTRDVTVSAGVDQYPDSPTNTLGSGTSVGVSVTVPLFIRYAYEGEIARAESDARTAEDQLERVIGQARAEVAAARSDLAAAADRLRRFEGSLLAEARRAVDYAEFAYRNGAIGVLDLLDARRTYRAVVLDAANARADYAKAWARWRAGLTQPLAQSSTGRP